MTLCDATNPFGASWGSDDTILYGQPEGIMRVSANGGTPELVVPTEAAEQVHGPQMLPGGEWVLFTLTSAGGVTRWDEAQIVVQSLESIYAGLGENDRAIEWLERAYQAHVANLPYIKVHSRWNPLRDDPRFQDLLRSMNLEP